MSARIVTHDDIRAAVRLLALSGKPICVHSSLRSFGWVEGGAESLVDGLLAEACTVLVPTFTSVFQVAPPDDRRCPRNGCDYRTETWPGDRHTDCYSTGSLLIDADLGVVPATVVSNAKRIRGDHPSNSFSAVGPLAPALLAGQRPLRVYAPLEELAGRDGWVVLMGVNLTSMTLIHLAEQRAGRALFRRWARDCSGALIEMELGSCSRGFERLQPALAPITRTIVVGQSHWRAYPAAEVLEIASATIRRSPGITHCPDPNCVRCHDAILGGPVLDGLSL